MIEHSINRTLTEARLATMVFEKLEQQWITRPFQIRHCQARTEAFTPNCLITQCLHCLDPGVHVSDHKTQVVHAFATGVQKLLDRKSVV